MTCNDRSRVLTGVLCLGWALSCVGCGGGLQEGIPSNIDPQRPPDAVKAMQKAGAEAKRAAEEARAKGKKYQTSPRQDAMPKKPFEQGPA